MNGVSGSPQTSIGWGNAVCNAAGGISVPPEGVMDRPAQPDRTHRAAPARVAVVVVNYNTAGLAVDCLRSLAAERGAGEAFRAIIVDNASPDGSAQILGEEIVANGWGDWAELLPLDRNVGFAAGNNAALRPILAAEKALLPPSPRRGEGPASAASQGEGRGVLSRPEASPPRRASEAP